MCLNTFSRLQEDPLPAYHSIKIRSEFQEYFISDRSQPSYSGNSYIYNYLGNLMLAELTNYTCVKSSMANQAYKVVKTHAQEISVWTIIYIIIHVRAPILGRINCGIQYELSNLAFNNG